MIHYLFLTALTVSIDSFVCGFSLALINKKKLPIIIEIALTVFLMCAIVNYSTKMFNNFLTEKTSCLGGIILVFVGIYNILKSKIKKNNCKTDKNISGQIFITGIAVGIDGALANLSLALMDINQFYVPITIAIMHALMIWLGIMLSSTKIARKFAKIELFSPFILICLGVYKMLGLFI